jgi:hypothetical protein
LKHEQRRQRFGDGKALDRRLGGVILDADKAYGGAVPVFEGSSQISNPNNFILKKYANIFLEC